MVGEQFWRHWIELYAPTLTNQLKWFDAFRQIKVGDVVLVADSNTLRGEYRLARVAEVHPSKDGHIRCATVCYKNFRVGEAVNQYKGAPYTSVKRSVQRLALLVPVSELEEEVSESVSADKASNETISPEE